MSNGRLLAALLIGTGLIGSLVSGAAFYTHLLAVGLILLIGAWLWVAILARSLHLTRKPQAWLWCLPDLCQPL